MAVPVMVANMAVQSHTRMPVKYKTNMMMGIRMIGMTTEPVTTIAPIRTVTDNIRAIISNAPLDPVSKEDVGV